MAGNRYDLAAIARVSGGAPRGAVTLRPIVETRALVTEALAFGTAVVSAWRDHLRDVVLPAYGAALDALTRDAAGDNLSVAINASIADLTRLVLTLQPRMNQWTVRVESWHRRRFADLVKAATGVDTFPFLSVSDVDDEIAAALGRHAGLIRGLSDDLRRRVEETVWREFLNQTARTKVAKMLSEQIAIGRRRARIIARDQTTKLAAELDKLRQQQAGIDAYVWRHSGKLHYRPEHRARDGKIFRWDDPPYDGPPGYAINCGCKAQAHVEVGSN